MNQPDKAKENNRLFLEFPRPRREDWEQLVARDLGDDAYARKLVWKTGEGFDVQPMYLREDLRGLAHLGFVPGEAPFVRGATALDDASRPWGIAQRISVSNPVEANAEARNVLRRGQTEVVFEFDRATTSILIGDDWLPAVADGGVSVQDVDDYTNLIRNLDGSTVELQGGLSSLSLLALGAAAGRPPAHADFDPVSSLVREGSIPFSIDRCFVFVADAIRSCEDKHIDATLLTANGGCFHNGGATAVQEVAFTLATGVEYVNRLVDHGLSAETAARRIRFDFSTGTNFFMEIAKLRAARALWAKIIKHFGVEDETSVAMRMHVDTSWWYQTKYDPWVNMLRCTVESMAAAIGGADSICASPFDDVVNEPGEFSNRIARNIQLILQEESHLGQAMDPAAGSYYVEQLTDSVGRNAWSLFRNVEQRGGLVASLHTGFLQRMIAESADKKRKDIASRREILIGTNQYPNPTEELLTETVRNPNTVSHLREATNARSAKRKSQPITLEGNIFDAMRRAFLDGADLREINNALRIGSGEETVEAIPQFRAAEAFERIRDAVAASQRTPVVFLATLGSAFWRKARATFASGFFGTAGISVIDHPGFDSPEIAVSTAIEAQADVIVLCSDDESYPVLAPVVVRRLREVGSSMQVVIAGYPKDNLEQLRSAGVEEFIHVKADMEATLASILGKIGVLVN